MNAAELDAFAWIVVDEHGKQIAGPHVLRLFAEHKARALGPYHSIVPVLNVGKSAAAAWWRV
jgi:hypothetical protein